MTTPSHPAKFSKSVLAAMEVELIHLADEWDLAVADLCVLDPFAGVGKIHGLPARTVGVELEPEWAAAHPATEVGDARALRWPDGTFDVVATSPTYGNRLSDHHVAKDGSRRHSYTHDLGRKLTEGNTGEHSFANHQPETAPYRILHRLAWAEAARVLKPDGAMLLNLSNFMANWDVQNVIAWHVKTLGALGFRVTNFTAVATPRLRYGANRANRVEGELVLTLRRSDTP